jgi:hypothetical protein
MLKISFFCLLACLVTSGSFQHHPDQYDYDKKEKYIVLSVIFGTTSHAKSMLYIGEEMAKRGHEIVYMGTPTTVQFAKGSNIRAIPLKTPPDIQSFKPFTSNMIDKDALKSNGYSDDEIKKTGRRND